MDFDFEFICYCIGVRIEKHDFVVFGNQEAVDDFDFKGIRFVKVLIHN